MIPVIGIKMNALKNQKHVKTLLNHIALQDVYGQMKNVYKIYVMLYLINLIKCAML